MMNSNKVETINTVVPRSLSDRDRPVITTTLYDLVAATQSALGPDDERVVPTVTRIRRTG